MTLRCFYVAILWIKQPQAPKLSLQASNNVTIDAAKLLISDFFLHVRKVPYTWPWAMSPGAQSYTQTSSIQLEFRCSANCHHLRRQHIFLNFYNVFSLLPCFLGVLPSLVTHTTNNTVSLWLWGAESKLPRISEIVRLFAAIQEAEISGNRFRQPQRTLC